MNRRCPCHRRRRRDRHRRRRHRLHRVIVVVVVVVVVAKKCVEFFLFEVKIFLWVSSGEKQEKLKLVSPSFPFSSIHATHWQCQI